MAASFHLDWLNWKWFVSSAITVGKSALAVYTLLLVVAFLGQRWLMYPAPKPARLPEHSRGKLVVIDGGNHRRIHAYHVPAQADRPTVVLFHGNAEQLADQVDPGEDFADFGLGVFAIEYPGYGLSSAGSMTEKNVYQDSESALQYLETQLNVRSDSLVLFGRSLGTGVAVEMAARGHGRRLILVSPFTSMVDMAAKTLPVVPARWLVLDRFDSLAKAPGIRLPTLVVHGDRDSVVPVIMGRRIAERIRGASIHIVDGAAHNDILNVGGQALWTRIVKFALATDNGNAPNSTARSQAGPEPSPEQTIAFAFRPTGASDRSYEMHDSLDQHHLYLMRGLAPGKANPLVIALHGQPRRGEAPRNYRFPRVVHDITRDLVVAGQIEPVILAVPVFRFEGQNWPQFDLVEFAARLRQILVERGVAVSGTYVFGHSGAAGCGGEGLNRAAALTPSAVGFFDTCVGSGFVQAASELSRRRIPTFIAHSVETAGFVPRQPVEYSADFDFGKIDSKIGLHPSECPKRLPEVPLRPLASRCATNAAGTTLALVLDTGRGEPAHEALVPVALRYFLREYVQNRETHRPSD